MTVTREILSTENAALRERIASTEASLETVRAQRDNITEHLIRLSDERNNLSATLANVNGAYRLLGERLTAKIAEVTADLADPKWDGRSILDGRLRAQESYLKGLQDALSLLAFPPAS